MIQFQGTVTNSATASDPTVFYGFKYADLYIPPTQKDRLTAHFRGMLFLSTDAFITDQSGARLLLGVHKEEGGLKKLFGENNRPTFSVNMTVRLDDDGNFKEVTSGKKTYSMDEWTKHVQNTFR